MVAPPAEPCHPDRRFSLVVATVNREGPLLRLLGSLARQQSADFEVIVVDQNRSINLAPLLTQERWPFAMRHLRVGDVGGASAARNAGWRRARGEILVFPDDDCWYPDDYLARMDAVLRRTGARLVTGRAADMTGRTINGRFERDACPIRRGNAFTTQIEWNMSVDAALMRELGGYDEAISLGGRTPWQGGEGYDLVLRALAAGAPCFYDPALVGHHEELPVAQPDAAMIAKGRTYARGLGFVLRKHGYGPGALAWWAGRSLFNLARAALSLRGDRTRYFAGQALGRVEGWMGGAGSRVNGRERKRARLHGRG